ncbi:ABC transporter permease [Mycobacterium sp. GA-2829]|uniref:ABC transporter permease n=1 Tax=Mycobacterium sp. GA-2829 TaxID=1772283 RepID=UPI0007401FC3|nr:ABC transporter permease [Mycobacterium sp. GA-2829]KUI39126.1 peptide ABC transporter permease [Mycobacterium sp. GA-2829]
MTITHNGSRPTDSAILRDDTFPDVEHSRTENSPLVLLPHAWVQTKRLLTRFLRDPMTFFFGVVFPIFMLLVLDIVLGDAILAATGESAVYGNVPLMTVIGAMNGASVGAVGIIAEQNDGLLARLWVTPIHRASGLLARIFAEALRVVVNSVVLLGVGIAMGLRFEGGVPAALAWLCIPVLFGVAFAIAVLTVALYWPSPTMVNAIVLVNSLCLFFSSGFVPLNQYPEWIQPIVEHQPVSYAIETMRGLSLGGPVQEPGVGIVLWSVGVVLVCLLPMVIGYRKASMRG